MNYGNVPTNIGLIDSLTIYLPLDKIKVIDEKLISDFVPYYPDLDDVDEILYPPKPIMIQHGGINYRFNKIVFPPTKDKPPEILIRLTLTSKMLKEYYFSGINIDNISKVIEHVNTSNVINFSLETALDSICNDIDICINYYLQYEAYKIACFYFKKCVIDSKQDKVSIYPRKQTQSLSKNFGIMFGERDKGSVGTPFVKYYNKEDELINHSTDFYNKYIFPQLKYGLTISNLIRKEITIKNAAFKKSLLKKHLVDIDNPLRTLRDILSISPEQLTKICNIQLKYYFKKRVITASSDLSPTNKIISFYLAKLIDLGCDKIELLSALNLFECKVQKSITKKRLEELIRITVDTNYLEDLLTNNRIANDFIRGQNIWN